MNWTRLKKLLGFVSDDKPIEQVKPTKPRARKVDFYYSNLINSLILFGATPEYLETLEGPVFNVMSELDTELDYAFTPVLFEEIFDKGLVHVDLKKELLEFKKMVDQFPNELWRWEDLTTNSEWSKLRQQANILLDKLGVENRTYNEDFTTVYGQGGIIKDSKYEIEN